MKNNIRKIATCSILGAISAILMLISFSVPLMPAFIKLDFSEVPALIATFSLGPVYGVYVCLIKNLINIPFSSGGIIGIVANFLIGICLIVPAGIIYKRNKTKKGALIASLIGSLIMAVISIFINYYITYPIYSLFLPMKEILSLYNAICPKINNLWQALTVFNMPFTLIKGLIDSIITFLVYKKLSPIIKGN